MAEFRYLSADGQPVVVDFDAGTAVEYEWDGDPQTLPGTPQPPRAVNQADLDAKASADGQVADLATWQAGQLTRAERLDRLGSDQALTRLREIRDTALTADTATLRASMKDIARYLIEVAKVLGDRETDAVEQ